VIDGLKPYPAMKDSGVPWLGGVPEHWEVRKVREVARVINGFPFDAARFSKLTGYPLIRIRDLDKAKTATCYEGPFVEAAKVESGDVLIGMDGDFNVGRWRGAEPALLNQRMCCLRSPEPVTESLLAYALPWPLKQINEVTWSTTVKHLASGQVERIQCSFPPLPEQAAIVRFLDHADRKIRRYIRAKQKLIKLLEEQKQAIIHRAVTRGLDPNVQLKPSGVVWLGDIPEHWEAKRAKMLFHEVDYRTTTGTEELLSLRMYQGLVPHREVSTVPISADALVGFKKVRIGQLVMNRMRAAIGMFGIANHAGLVSPDYAVLEPIDAQVLEYFLRLFKTSAAGGIFRIESKGLGTGSAGFMRLYTDRFGMIKLPVPPMDEQQQIVQEISDGIAEIERTGVRLKREIELLHEYRTRLIADVVTGKLDVREAAAKLLDEDQELQPIDESDEISDAEEDGFDDLDEGTEESEP